MLLLLIKRELMVPRPVPKHTSILTGAIYFAELMETENNARFRACARMSKETFQRLLARAMADGGLKDSRKISAGEKLMIFLYVLSGKSNRDAQERWQHSGDSISKVVAAVRVVILSMRLYVSTSDMILM